METVCLVTCASTKLEHSAPASAIYASDPFRKSKAYAMSRFDRWFILSAKHGLLDPERVIEPYDLTLNAMTRADRRAWADAVLGDMRKLSSPDDAVAIVAGACYRRDLVPMLSSCGYSVVVPMAGLRIGQQLQVLKRIATRQQRLADIDRFYGLLGALREGLGSHMLSECNGSMPWPDRGVYFTLDAGEQRMTDITCPRVVRVGTHALAQDSRSTLWQRIRQHRGPVGLGGNHRGSVFRKHVGAAMISGGLVDDRADTWGKGTHAPQDVRHQETMTEKAVSRYLGRMEVLWLSIDDDPGPNSDRSHLERNAIALLGGPPGPLDIPSHTWLGKQSPSSAIRGSGLWNVRHTDGGYDRRFLDAMAQYVEATLT